jgi:hypothetical protein
VQVNPIKPKLKPLRTERLKLTYENLLSSFAFKCNLRRYSKAEQGAGRGASFEVVCSGPGAAV